jgi:hypothetical protein
MCNLYAIMEARAEVARLARAMHDRNDNQPPMPGVYPDYPAPVIVTTEDGSREMRNMRWGMPTSKQALFKAATERADKLRAKGTEFDFAELLKLEPDKGTTNVRNTTNTQGKTNAHWGPGSDPPTAAWCPSPPSPSPTRTMSAPARISGSPSTTAGPWPSSPASGRPMRAFG